MHFLQQWFSLSDLAMEGALLDVPLHRELAQPDVPGRLPDESTIFRFGKTPSPRPCHRPGGHQLARQILASEPDMHSSQRKALDKQSNCLDALIDLLEKTKACCPVEQVFAKPELWRCSGALWAICSSASAALRAQRCVCYCGY